MDKRFFVICDNIRSLENIGSIFRTSDALGVDKIYLCGISGKPPHPKISKTALGAENSIPFEHHWQIWKVITALKKQGFQIIVLEKLKQKQKFSKKEIVYNKFKPRFPLALVLGNEVNGVSQSVLDKSDKIVYLPMLGKKESLNVAVAFGIMGYEINKNRFKK
jgi:tRNA G18 (ribose-2'-O)-methylase SpoU